MALSPEQQEPVSTDLCGLPVEQRDGWPHVCWHGAWHPVPTMGDVEEWTFDSVCPTPHDKDVEPDHPESWLRILGIC